MKTIYAASSVAAVLFATPVAAQDKPFDGPSVTVISGVDVDRVSGRSNTGALYGAQLGYDVQSRDTVFGLEAEVTGSTAKGCRDFTSTLPAGSYLACASAGRDLYVGGRLGIVMGAATMLYGKVGYTNARSSYSLSYLGNPSSNFAGRGNADGFRVGAGIERLVAGRVLIKAEYRYSNYDRFTIRHQVAGGVGVRF